MPKDKKTKRQKCEKAKKKDIKTKDKYPKESFILWCQGSFALLRCFPWSSYSTTGGLCSCGWGLLERINRIQCRARLSTTVQPLSFQTCILDPPAIQVYFQLNVCTWAVTTSPVHSRSGLANLEHYESNLSSGKIENWADLYQMALPTFPYTLATSYPPVSLLRNPCPRPIIGLPFRMQSSYWSILNFAFFS